MLAINASSLVFASAGNNKMHPGEDSSQMDSSHSLNGLHMRCWELGKGLVYVTSVAQKVD